jgi:oligoribonuclease NrnB/cAMP/cGMP phosphodiesterase (DHH superfamily)
MDNFTKKLFKPRLLDIIIFHYPCQDGLASAWVVHNYLVSKDKEHELIPVQNSSYSEEFINKLYEKVKNKYVGIFDFSFNLEITKKLKENTKGLIILDHHVTNKDTLQELDYAYFDMNLSGVGLTWSFIHPKKTCPVFLQMIQDRDLWTWKLPLSRDFCDGFYYYVSINDGFESSFTNFEELYGDEEKATIKYVQLGKILRQKKDKTINGIVRSNKKIYNFKFNNYNYKVQMVNCDHEIASDLGNAICKNGLCDFVVLWRYDHNSEKYWISMRADNKADVSEIAKSFGGGGHKNASGCTLNKHPIEIFSN